MENNEMVSDEMVSEEISTEVSESVETVETVETVEQEAGRYFVTGGTGFIGRFLLEQLIQRGVIVHALVRNEASAAQLADLAFRYGAKEGQVVPVFGDLTAPSLGLDESLVEELSGRIDHFFHLAGIYDLDADEVSLQLSNVQGTRHAIQAADALQVGCFHHTSSIAAAGLYKGTFYEDMFEEAYDLKNAYYRTKHLAEKLVREECERPWRIYRPGIVIGHSQTGEADKVDGPYFFFKLLQLMGNNLPQWMPALGIKGGKINIVPVDFVVDAMLHIAHVEGLDGECFHLTDPNATSVGEAINIFARTAKAPQLTSVEDTFNKYMPRSVRRSVKALPKLGLMAASPLAKVAGNLPVKQVVSSLPLNQITNALPLKALSDSLPQVKQITSDFFTEFGISPKALELVNYPTDFDCSETERALQGSDIACPPLDSYAHVIWEYWENYLDPGLYSNRSLRERVSGKTILITGATSGIGLSTARQLASMGCELIIVARTEEKLIETQRQLQKMGSSVHYYPCDLSDLEACDQLVEIIKENHGRVDILINNAGRSIRRSVANSLDRFHDFQRTMQLNYFSPLKLITGLLPVMAENGRGHIINISSIGVLAKSPRFSAYVASKAALDNFSACAASEFAHQNIQFTTINMPLVRTPMISATDLYNKIPVMTPKQAGELVCKAIIKRPKRVASPLGKTAQLIHNFTPKLGEKMMSTSFRMFSDSKRAQKHLTENTTHVA